MAEEVEMSKQLGREVDGMPSNWLGARRRERRIRLDGRLRDDECRRNVSKVEEGTLGVEELILGGGGE